MMSATITVATSPVPSAIVTTVPEFVMQSRWLVSTGLKVRPRRDAGCRQLAVIDVIQKHVGQLLLVLRLKQRLDVPAGRAAEASFVGANTGEWAGARKRLGQTGSGTAASVVNRSVPGAISTILRGLPGSAKGPVPQRRRRRRCVWYMSVSPTGLLLGIPPWSLRGSGRRSRQPAAPTSGVQAAKGQHVSSPRKCMVARTNQIIATPGTSEAGHRHAPCRHWF